jgi:hypothetical protein
MAKRRSAGAPAGVEQIAQAELEPVGGPQADSVSPGEGAPSADPRSPSQPGPVMVDRIREVTHPRRPPRRVD